MLLVLRGTLGSQWSYNPSSRTSEQQFQRHCGPVVFRESTSATDASTSPLRRESAVAAYGAPPGLISSGYGPGADAATAAGHPRHHSFSHAHDSSTGFPYTSQRSPRRQHSTTVHPYTADNGSPAYPTSASSGGGNYTTSPAMHEPFEIPSAKRRKVSGADISRRHSQVPTTTKLSPSQRASIDQSSPSSLRRGSETIREIEGSESRRQSESLDAGRPVSSPTVSKPKRVRTGCLTCRNRHLKCDEALPICMNCQKSNRKCERGVRLNFIDLKVEQPPYLLPPVDWKVQFQDESRQIASEYMGGLARYAKLGQHITIPRPADLENAPRPRVDASDPTASGHFIDHSGPVHAPPHAGLDYPGPPSRPYHEPTYTGYEDQINQMYTRKSSDPFLPIGSGPTPTSSHSGAGTRPASFSFGPSHDNFPYRDEARPPMHQYRTSDVSSVASSLIAQGVAASSSGSFRHETGSGPPDSHDGLMTPQSEKDGERDYLSTPEEIHYMQVFIDEVAVWMDSLDNQKHFGRVIPYLALKSPMLLNAFLACGVKHLTLVDGGSYKDDKALYYYDTATTQLLRSLQNPERNTAECATTAVVLNVYEIMSEKPAARMNHIAGARALIRECKWDAQSTGIGAACFWLNVGMEILSCLAFNWATAWDPDQWGVPPSELMNMAADSPGSEGQTPKDNGRTRTADDFPSTTGHVSGVGDEEIWVHRILYIVAKVANFRANIPQFQEPSPHDEQARLQSRFAEWQRLKNWCDMWNANCPRSMRPYGYLFSSSTKSAFPNVWLIKRSAIVGRLFYHTAMCLLAQINPLKPPVQHGRDDDEIRTVQLHHAHQVCGIVAHTKDHGVASVAIRSLAVAGSVLTEPREQYEVLDILKRIYHRTGWNLKRVESELKRAWGWEPPEPLGMGGSSGPGSAAGLAHHPGPAQPAPIAPASRGGTLGAAAVLSQLFRPHDSPITSTTTTTTSSSTTATTAAPSSILPKHTDASCSRRASQPALPLPSVEPRRPSALRTISATSGPTFTQPLYSASTVTSAASGGGTGLGSGRHASITTASPSAHASPAATTTAHTPASVSSMAGNASAALTPPSNRPMVNPLLAQADFNQPNHPYREWYKPPDRTAHSSQSGTFGDSGLWPY